jgi:hypothetical protein
VEAARLPQRLRSASRDPHNACLPEQLEVALAEKEVTGRLRGVIEADEDFRSEESLVEDVCEGASASRAARRSTRSAA